MEATLAVLNRLVDEGVVERYAIGGAVAAMLATDADTRIVRRPAIPSRSGRRPCRPMG